MAIIEHCRDQRLVSGTTVRRSELLYHVHANKSLSRGPFLESPRKFSGRKTIFRSSVSNNREVYMPETSCMKGTSLRTAL